MNALESDKDPFQYFRSPSWHDRSLSDLESLMRKGNLLQIRGYASELAADHSAARNLPMRQEGKPSVCEVNMSEEVCKQWSKSRKRKRQVSSKKETKGVDKEEEEEEDLFQPPVHFASHQRTNNDNGDDDDDEHTTSLQWRNEGEDEGEGELGEGHDLSMLEPGELPRFMSTFRARLDETKCHKRKRTPSGNLILPITPPDQQHDCPQCQASFVDVNNLRRHISHSHPDKIGGNPKGRKCKHCCEECGKMFDRLSRLECHKVVHSNEKPFVCYICQKAFSRTGNLKIHLHLHSGEKTFSCDLCKKAFSDAGKLKNHQVVHTGDKPFVCDICHKGFTEKGNLKRHKKYHIGRKEFACDVCGKAFIESGMLRRHKVQTNHSPIMCFVCNRTFLFPEKLEEHSKVHAGESRGDVGINLHP